MEKIVVFGATGGTGKLVVEQALQAGHQVRFSSGTLMHLLSVIRIWK